MQVNVSQLLREPIGSTRNYEINEVVEFVDNGTASLVKGNITLIRTDRGILVKGMLHTSVKLECSRCLRQFGCPMAVKIEEEYFPTVDVVSGAPMALPDEPGVFTINEQHILDLTEAIRQNAIVAIPMKPLCREDCAGLCPKCGKDLNQGECGCSTEEVDPRWAKLLKLKE